MKRPDRPGPDSPRPGEFIRLDQFLKIQQQVPSGGAAKWAVRHGEVKVNGQLEMRRGRKLYHGDTVEFAGCVLPVEFQNEQTGSA